jgi:hypothetical protein
MTARAWLAIAALVIIFLLGFLYIGVTHRDRCLRYGGTGCTILPWSGSQMEVTGGSMQSAFGGGG